MKSPNKKHVFDYVVVGGGTGGLTIAMRLAQDSNVTVAVVEAGMRYQVASPLLESIPGADVLFAGTGEVNQLVDWGFKTKPDPASNNKARSYARGKCLGGSSARNFMIYQRPTVQTLDKWAQDVGDKSWSFENFFPYYQKSTHFTPPGPNRNAGSPTLYNPEAFIKTGGPLSVSYPNFAQAFSSYMEGAMNEINVPTIRDFNTGALMGCQYASTTIKPKSQTRDSSQTSFLNAARSEGLTNLKVFTLTMAEQILFGPNRRAIGVRVKSKLKSFTLHANKEVILSAGAFQSPQILMVSGIGPAEELKKLRIPLIADRPGVGQNMQDHIFFGPAYRVDVTTLTKLANNPLFLLKNTLSYVRKKGPLTNNVTDFLGWEKVPEHLRPSLGEEALQELSQFPPDWPEIEYLSGAGYVGDWSGLLFKQPRDGYQYATILAALVAPLSRGTVTLQSSDTKDLPIINTAYLTSPTDQRVAIAAYRRVREAFATNFMQQIVIGDEYYPGMTVQTDDEILDKIKDGLQTVWHASCTCKMGKAEDEMAVVDSHARVLGVQGLRVVDASAFPFLPPGHPQSTIYALAEKVAEFIKNGE